MSLSYRKVLDALSVSHDLEVRLMELNKEAEFWGVEFPVEMIEQAREISNKLREYTVNPNLQM